MPKVKFLQDFQGKETREVFYKFGQEVELPDHMTAVLIADRRVELVREEDAPAYYETGTGDVVYAEPDIFVEPQAEEIQDVTTTESAPKRSKRGKK
jgi:hypothetical protein